MQIFNFLYTSQWQLEVAIATKVLKQYLDKNQYFWPLPIYERLTMSLVVSEGMSFETLTNGRTTDNG